ncbi:MAG: YitT family protein [Desulfovibrio sp.]|uniref:YitT family protein n=1 Tax=Desulfovibrio sp. TaxID=885 RepID=UPI00135EDFF6|nr:YitT family protein [Desulfovibrio sp.]MTJ91892.1 YitT family protein [Desulfovibrio sp.]
MKLHSYNKALAESVVWNLLWLTLGSVLMAICIQSVAAPHGFLSGGVMGVSLLVGYWTDTLTPLVWYSVLCVPVYVFGWFCVGKRFLLYTAYGTLCTTLCSFLITFTIPIESEVYATVVGGVLHGAACGIMLRTLGSSGGTDVVAVLLKERWNVPIGQFNFLFNCLLFLTAASRMPLDLIVASMLMMFISANTLEYVLGLFNRRKLVMIISDHGEEISEAILVTERFGATLMRGKGAYSGSDREILLTVTNNVALKRLENLVFSIDPRALFIVENTFYVSGGQFARSSR